MGYRSDFQILINTDQKSQYVFDWMESYSHRGTYAGDLMREIIDYALGQFTLGTILFEESGWKLGDNWDELVTDLLHQYENDDSVEIAYIRIGESYDDIEIHTEPNTYVYVQRSLGCPVSHKIEKKKSQVAIPVASVATEEECHCGKTKDAGQKCWWCGN